MINLVLEIKMRWLVLIYVLLQLCNVVCSTEYEWIKNAITYPSVDTVLQNHVLKEYTTKHLLTQCAMECLKNVFCMSYNFDSPSKTCQLNDATHVDFPGDVAASSFQYFMRDAYTIDPVR